MTEPWRKVDNIAPTLPTEAINRPNIRNLMSGLCRRCNDVVPTMCDKCYLCEKCYHVPHCTGEFVEVGE